MISHILFLCLRPRFHPIPSKIKVRFDILNITRLLDSSFGGGIRSPFCTSTSTYVLLKMYLSNSNLPEFYLFPPLFQTRRDLLIKRTYYFLPTPIHPPRSLGSKGWVCFPQFTESNSKPPNFPLKDKERNYITSFPTQTPSPLPPSPPPRQQHAAENWTFKPWSAKHPWHAV